MVRLRVGLTLMLLGLTFCGFAAAEEANWPGWRGPTRDGKVAGAPWPKQLNEANFKQQWRIELGPSYSGPVVVDDRVFVTETVDRKEEVVRCLQRGTGKELWKVQWPGAMTVPFFAASNGSWIRATPACDGERLYVAGMRDVLVCLNAATGEEVWRVDFMKEFKSPLPAFGFVSSPLVLGDHLFVQAGAGLVKLNKNTGKVLWRVLEDGGGMWWSAFSSPYVAKLAGEEQLIVQTRTKLCGVNLDSGAELWSQEIPAFRGMNILTPTVFGDSVFTSAYGGKSLLIDVTRADGKFVPAEKWQNKTQGYMSTPLIIGDYAYLHLRNQRFTCLNLKEGKEVWTTTPFGKYWSLVAQNDRILALDERGELLLIQANPEKFELINRLKVSDGETWAHLAVAGDNVFIRELNAIAAYRWSDAE